MADRDRVRNWRERWNRSLMLFLRQRVRTGADIEDLAQETYLRLLRSDGLDHVENPQAYLLTVASHVLAEWRRRERSVGAAASEMEIDELVELATPEFELEAQISQARLTDALNQAPSMMRAALILRLRDDRSYKDIARDLGLTDRQVRRMLAKGYQRLHVALDAPTKKAGVR